MNEELERIANSILGIGTLRHPDNLDHLNYYTLNLKNIRNALKAAYISGQVETLEKHKREETKHESINV